MCLSFLKNTKKNHVIKIERYIKNRITINTVKEVTLTHRKIKQ